MSDRYLREEIWYDEKTNKLYIWVRNGTRIRNVFNEAFANIYTVVQITASFHRKPWKYIGGL